MLHVATRWVIHILALISIELGCRVWCRKLPQFRISISTFCLGSDVCLANAFIHNLVLRTYLGGDGSVCGCTGASRSGGGRSSGGVGGRCRIGDASCSESGCVGGGYCCGDGGCSESGCVGGGY